MITPLQLQQHADWLRDGSGQRIEAIGANFCAAHPRPAGVYPAPPPLTTPHLSPLMARFQVVFLSFNPTDGRIGRIAWSNGNEETWGKIRWDLWWPSAPPPPSLLQKAVAELTKAMKQFGQALRQALQ